MTTLSKKGKVVGQVGKYGKVVITSGEFVGVKAIYFTDIKNKAILSPLTNPDFEIVLSCRDFKYID